jgi:hypothetical protein
MAYETTGCPASISTSRSGTLRGRLMRPWRSAARFALGRAAFAAAIAEKPAGRFMIRSRTCVVKRRPEGDW